MLNYQRVCENVVLFGKYPKKSDPKFPISSPLLCLTKRSKLSLSQELGKSAHGSSTSMAHSCCNQGAVKFFRLTNLLPSGKPLQFANWKITIFKNGKSTGIGP
jgi:hypothetical protein